MTGTRNTLHIGTRCKNLGPEVSRWTFYAKIKANWSNWQFLWTSHIKQFTFDSHSQNNLQRSRSERMLGQRKINAGSKRALPRALAKIGEIVASILKLAIWRNTSWPFSSFLGSRLRSPAACWCSYFVFKQNPHHAMRPGIYFWARTVPLPSHPLLHTRPQHAKIHSLQQC